VAKGTKRHLDRLYAALERLAAAPGQGRPLRELPGKGSLPERGVYFFREPGETRSGKPETPRIVRVGTHAGQQGLEVKASCWTS
jgi:hypothetical protein